ncbi:MAG TPA: hypothetical protein VN040_27665 [Pseudosphingobacterium sp.]|nr:hypothetical protein [Pseudosphingobacterium sp.]
MNDAFLFNLSAVSIPLLPAENERLPSLRSVISDEKALNNASRSLHPFLFSFTAYLFKQA